MVISILGLQHEDLLVFWWISQPEGLLDLTTNHHQFGTNWRVSLRQFSHQHVGNKRTCHYTSLSC